MNTPTGNLRKAAVLVANLDMATTDRLLAHLSEEQARRLREAVVDLGVSTPEEQQQVLEEFFQNRSRPQSAPLDGVQLEGSLRDLALPEPPPSADDEHVSSAPFEFLHEAPAAQVIPYLADEHPQTVALVLAHLPRPRAAEVLAGLSGSLQADVVRRLVHIQDTSPEVVRDVEQALAARFTSASFANNTSTHGVLNVSEILRAGDPQHGHSILSNLQEHDQSLAQRIQPDECEFPELAALDETSLSRLVGETDFDVWRLALMGAEGPLGERVARCVGAARAKQLRGAPHSLGPLRLSDIEAAQKQIAQMAGQLAAAGRIRLPQRVAQAA